MSTLRRRTAHLAVVASFAALLAAACSPDSTGPSSKGPSSPGLLANRKGGGGGGGTPAASTFAVLGQAAVTCTDGSIIGDVGTFQATPPGAITLTTCPVTGTTHIGDAAAIAAFNAFLTQYAALAPLTGDCDLAHTLLSTIPASVTLPPGVYCTGAALTATDVTLTLDAGGNANATWVFKIGTPGPAGTGALTGTNLAVLLANGAQACNVTWWVSQAATIKTTITPGTAFQGNILAGAAITTTGGTLHGNTWAGAKADVTGVRVGDVTLTGTAVTGCASSGKPNGGGDGEGDDDDDGHGGKGHHDRDKDKHHDKDRDHDSDKHHDKDKHGGDDHHGDGHNG
jgi:hypothetical protein